jgi:hypothetical protein
MYFGWFGEAFGTNIHRYARVDFDGNLLSTLGGYTVSPFIYAGAKLLPDGFGGVYFHSYSSSSSFFGIAANRFDSLGVSLWNGVQVLVPQTSMASLYTAVSDTGGITAFYSGANALEARRLKSNGAADWNNESRIICDAEGSQVDAQVIRKPDGEYVLAWADSRPGAEGQFAVYGQRVDSEMNPLWEPNGVLLSNQATGTYQDMNIGLMSDEQGIFTLTQKAGSTVWATRFTSDGQVISPPGDIEVIIPPTPLPLNGDFKAIGTENHSIASWSDGSDLRIICFVGCSSTLISNTITACESFGINGQTFESSGVYTIELPGDTILELDLTIVNFEAGVLLNEFTLSAADTYSSYTWISCADNQILSEGSNTFSPAENGEYALVASLNECSDTSDCVMVSGVGLESPPMSIIQVFPNPASDFLRVKLNGDQSQFDANILDITGKRVGSFTVAGNEEITISTAHLSPGLYYIQGSNDASFSTIRWIKIN